MARTDDLPSSVDALQQIVLDQQAEIEANRATIEANTTLIDGQAALISIYVSGSD